MSSAGDHSEGELGTFPEPSIDQVDSLLAKLNEHSAIVEQGSGGARASTAAATSGSSGTSPEPLSDSRKAEIIQVKISEIEQEAKNPGESMLQAFKRYKDDVTFGKVGGIKSRTAPHMLPRLYRGGRSAKQEMQGWLKSKELETCPAACEVLVLAMVLDRMLDTGEVNDLVNSRSAEMLCLRITPS